GLAAATPQSTDLVRGLETSEEHLGALERRFGRLPAARAQFAKSLAIAEKLLADHPTNDEFRIDVVESQIETASAADSDRAEKACGAAKPPLAALPAGAGEGDQLARFSIVVDRGLAEAAVRRGALPEARALAEESLARASTVADVHPDDPSAAEALARTLRV